MSDDPVDWLYGLQSHGIKLGLDGIRALLALLDRPEEEVLIAAAQALSRVGSTAALGRLVYASRRESLQEITRDVLLAAVEVLKDDRRPNAGGHLSVVADAVEARGGLSFEDRARALSFPEDDN